MEQELSEALPKVDDNDAYREDRRLLPSRAERCLCFHRTISDLSQFLDRAKVGKFINLMPNTNCIDVKTNQSAWRLRNAVRAMLSNDAVFHESVSWCDPEGVDAHAHADYLERMCDEFYTRARDMVDQQMTRRESVVSDPFYDDIVQNWHIARQYCDTFIGRDALLERIQRYIVKDTNQALVIHGDTGTGRSGLRTTQRKRQSVDIQYSTQIGLDNTNALQTSHLYRTNTKNTGFSKCVVITLTMLLQQPFIFNITLTLSNNP